MTTQTVVTLAAPCDCGGTFAPTAALKFHLDADGSGMVDTECTRCRLTSVTYFTWDAPGDWGAPPCSAPMHEACTCIMPDGHDGPHRCIAP